MNHSMASWKEDLVDAPERVLLELASALLDISEFVDSLSSVIYSDNYKARRTYEFVKERLANISALQ